MSTDELKPCPFCGCTDIADEDCSTMQTNGTRLACNECGAMVEGYGASTCTARAVAKWNRRDGADALRASRDKLVGLLREARGYCPRVEYGTHGYVSCLGDRIDAALAEVQP